ncbi:MAG: arsenate reductase [Wenzhouxiangella sp.]|jgi:arsenate reductase|nr:arsenate reductase [Wenzhouxiangella sp.]
MSAVRIYGIKSCDTCRKAMNWLDEQNMQYQWHDFRADGLDGEKVKHWLEAVGVETLVNRRSTTWRTLVEADRNKALDPQQAIDLLLEHPTLIKRPVIERDSRVFVGFNAAVRDTL